ncbi:PaaI family thioesterase [Marinobacter zhejiangensis]|uniref:Uncharacterized domain 1-containing protein n=1 Tax=Marinobacter zhejiangensis TaxID=488535 RepID=A0A1I4NZX0_9GAMM|nr:PaaI family thioesterase [Marinobacter zhejiangensis]SFM21134.1 uncharacterized domain 1-containing protein [Marinobacter zhejiangensis]
MTDTTLMDRVTRFIDTLQQSQALGLTVTDAAHNHLVLCLPYSKQIIGNPETGVIHGGAITTLMDTASGSVMICALPEFELCPTLDLRVDYMRAAEPHKPVYARAEAYRVTRNIIFTRCEAYQEPGKAVAQCVGTFMRIGKEATPKSYRDLITGDAHDNG